MQNILDKTLTLLSTNAFWGAFASSLISGLAIYFTADFLNRRKIILALKKELEMNSETLDKTLTKSIKDGKINPFINLHLDSYVKFKTEKTSLEDGVVNEVDNIYDSLGVIKSSLFSIQLGLRGCAKPDEIEGGWRNLILRIKELLNKL